WLLPPFAVVHHVGRRTGKEYRTPVVAFRSSQGYVIPMTYGRDVDSARNLVVARGGELERMGRRRAIRNPRIVGGEVAGPQLPPVVGKALLAAGLPGFVLVDLGPA